MDYIRPEQGQTAFNCPHCEAYAHQVWIFNLAGSEDFSSAVRRIELTKNYMVSQCMHCKEFAFWRGQLMIYPKVTIAPLPEEDMPDEIKKDFNEASQVFTLSPRSSAALLRLAVEKLCIHLGYSGDNINQAIGKMVADKLDPLIQQAFDAVRIIGNEAVHPGQIDLNDDPDTALELFKLVNFIVQEKITKPKQIHEIYSNLPQSKLQQIEHRDKKLKSARYP